MKKLFLLFVLFSLSVSSFAWDKMEQELERLNNKVKSMNVLSPKDIPYYFWWELSAGGECPECTNIFYRALHKHQHNPKNYIAAFNYAMLISYKSNQYGFFISFPQGEREFDEAYKRFEMAKNLNPDFLPVYVEQELLIDRFLFSKYYYSPNFYSLDWRLMGYENRKDLARKRLALIEKQIEMGVKRVNYLEAAILSRFFGLHEKEAFYTEQAGGKRAIEIEVENALNYIHSSLEFEVASTVRFGKISQVLAGVKERLASLEKYYGHYVKHTAEHKDLLNVMAVASAKESVLFHQMMKDPQSQQLP